MSNSDTLRQAVQLLHGGVTETLRDHAAWLARQALSPAELDTLAGLVTSGPVWDGDLPSKAARDTLVVLGLAVKCVAKGRQGFQAATDVGWRVYNAKLDVLVAAATIGFPSGALPQRSSPDA